ncbi:hypothetical protein [Pseudomonas putida]|uniref:hypothetical protein n=1 Tax=Pseudomonas putida TaxID=303 RepID=UPI001E3B0879|nr:hypothetical protein [Pseudomonas putida]
MTKPRTAAFPRELAKLIARKADAMARRLEDQATRQLVRSAQNALDRGATVAEIAKQLELQ